MIPELMSSSNGLWAWDLPEEPSYVGPALCPTSQLPHPLKPSQTNRSLPKPAGKSGSTRPALDRPPGLHGSGLAQWAADSWRCPLPSRTPPCDASGFRGTRPSAGSAAAHIQFSGGSATSPCSPETSTSQFTSLRLSFSTWKMDLTL